MYSSLLTIKFWFSPLRFSKRIWQRFDKFCNFCEKLEFLPTGQRVYRGHLWRVIKPKVQIVSDWKFVSSTLMPSSITGKNFRKTWDGGLHSWTTWDGITQRLFRNMLTKVVWNIIRFIIMKAIISISIVIGFAKVLFSSYKIVFEKVEHLYSIQLNIRYLT